MINMGIDSKRIFIIAGEASGDYLGGRLMNDIKSIRSDVKFRGIGGTCMINAGLQPIFSIDQLSVIGIWEVVKKALYMKKKIDETVQKILDYKPNVVVTIDFPGFTSRVSKALKAVAPNIPIVHYVAPSVWAWRSDRAQDMHEYVDKLLALLPFEPDLFKKYGLDTVFVGHPIATDKDFDEPSDYLKNDFLESIGFTPRYDKNYYQWKDNVQNWNDDTITIKLCGTVEAEKAVTYKFSREEKRVNMHDRFRYKIITLLPGSRKSEIDKHMPILKEFSEMLSRHYENVRFIIPTVDSLEEHVREYTDTWDVPPIITTSKKKKIFAFYVSDVAIAASGTVALELARVGIPSVIIYKTSAITAALVKYMIKIKYVSLVNILANQLVLPELLQKDCTAEKIFTCVTELIDNPAKRAAQKQQFKSIMKTLIPNDSQLAAQEVLKSISD